MAYKPQHRDRQLIIKETKKRQINYKFNESPDQYKHKAEEV